MKIEIGALYKDNLTGQQGVCTDVDDGRPGPVVVELETGRWFRARFLERVEG